MQKVGDVTVLTFYLSLNLDVMCKTPRAILFDRLLSAGKSLTCGIPKFLVCVCMLDIVIVEWAICL